MQDLKMTKKNERLEFDGLENDGQTKPNFGVGKMTAC